MQLRYLKKITKRVGIEIYESTTLQCRVKNPQGVWSEWEGIKTEIEMEVLKK